MIACVYCGRDVESYSLIGGVLVSPDGDFACSEICAEKYRYDWDHFNRETITDDQKFASWLGVPLSFL